MTNKVYGVDGVDYQAIHDQIGVPMYAIRHAVSRGLLDVNLDTSIALFIAYKSKGDFRDSLNRALIAWDDWKAGRPFLEPSLVSTHTGKGWSGSARLRQHQPARPNASSSEPSASRMPAIDSIRSIAISV
jgi:hypothetical protein